MRVVVGNPPFHPLSSLARANSQMQALQKRLRALESKQQRIRSLRQPIGDREPDRFNIRRPFTFREMAKGPTKGALKPLALSPQAEPRKQTGEDCWIVPGVCPGCARGFA